MNQRNAREPEEMIDIEEAPTPDDADLASVAFLADRVIFLEDEIVSLVELMKLKNLELKTLQESTLPLKMAELGMDSFSLIGGKKVVLDSGAVASLSEERKPAGFKWLNESGNGDLIKRTITITFNRGEETWAAKFMKDLSQRKKPVRTELKMTVHGNTLSAFVREQIRNAKADQKDPRSVIPYETLGVFEYTRAEVKRPKKKEESL